MHTGSLGAAALGDISHVDAQSGHTVLLCGGGILNVQDADAQHRAGHSAVFDQLLGNVHSGVDGDGKADALGLAVAALGVDHADQLTVCVEQTAAGVARADGCIGLDQGHIVIFHGDLTVQGADDALGNGVGQGAQRVAHSHGGLTDSQLIAVADDCRGQAGGIDLQHGNIGSRVDADNGGVIALVAAVELDLHAGSAADHMGAGEDVAILADDDAGTGTALHIVAAKPGLAAAHLLGGDGHHTGGGHSSDLLHGHRGAIGAAGVRGIGAGVALDFLHDHLVAGQAGTAGHHGTADAAAEAQGHHADTGEDAQQDLVMLFFFLGGLLRGTGVAVAIVAAVVAAIAAAETAGVAVVLAVGVVRLVVGVGTGVIGAAACRVIGAGGVGGVHAAAAHIGVAALLGLAGLIGPGCRSLVGFVPGLVVVLALIGVGRIAALAVIVKTGVIVFVAHTGPSFRVRFGKRRGNVPGAFVPFLLSMPIVYRPIVK